MAGGEGWRRGSGGGGGGHVACMVAAVGDFERVGIVVEALHVLLGWAVVELLVGASEIASAKGNS